LCACKKKTKFPYLSSQSGLTDFCQILHDNSTPQRNHSVARVQRHFIGRQLTGANQSDR